MEMKLIRIVVAVCVLFVSLVKDARFQRIVPLACACRIFVSVSILRMRLFLGFAVRNKWRVFCNMFDVRRG
jgi:hypothetical protein